NGPMDESLMDSGLVEHLQADGFQFKPRHPVDWMVCDIVEKPARNAALLETWIGEGRCREAVVNLKLPMKQRYVEVQRLLARIADGLTGRSVKVSIAGKQLYRAPEEVTCHLRRLYPVGTPSSPVCGRVTGSREQGAQPVRGSGWLAGRIRCRC